MMRTVVSSLGFWVVSWAVAGPAIAGNTLGDVNGDGRLSFGDAYLLGSGRMDLPIHPIDLVSEFECTIAERGYGLAAILSHEAIRRSSASPRPHFIERWPEAPIRNSAPDPSDVAVFEFVDVVHRGGDSAIELRVRMTSFEIIDAINLHVQVDGIALRPEPPVSGGDFLSALGSRTTDYLLADGEFVTYRSRLYRELSVDAFEQEFVLRGELPRGTAPGEYRVDLAPGSEVVTQFDEVLRPVSVAGVITIEDEVARGNDLPLAPLVFAEDVDGRRIEGTVELGFDDADAEGFPGNVAPVRVRVRSERPINRLRFWVIFDPQVLQVDEAEALYRDPDDGQVRFVDYTLRDAQGEPFCIACANRWGRLRVDYTHRNGLTATPYPERPHTSPNLKYLAPLGEWIDLLEIQFRIQDAAAGRGDLPLRVDTQESHSNNMRPTFVPYWGESEFAFECRNSGAPWTVEPTQFQEGRVRVLGDGEPVDIPPPIDPSDAQIRVQIGDGSAAPGEVARLPIDTRAAVDLSQLRFVLNYDAAALDFEGFEVFVTMSDGETETVILAPDDPAFARQICEGEGFERECRSAFPWIGQLRGEHYADLVPPDVLIADLFADVPGGSQWDAGTEYELGALRFRVRDGVAEDRLVVRGIETPWRPSDAPGEVSSVTAGYPILVDPSPRHDVPAESVTEGVIDVLHPQAVFVRGDADRSERVDLTDAIRTLAQLFLGDGELLCEDAADADDDGELSVTDSIFTLQFLFLGGPELPPPFPEPGRDPTDDALRCRG